MSGQPAAVPEPGAAAAGADNCDELLVSRSKPCGNNPNPCNINSGYPGDEYCMLPPDADKGVQVHFGPSDYTNKAEVERFVLKPGEEFNSWGSAPIPLTAEKFYSRVVYQMRPGSHHLINSLVTGQPEAGFYRTPNCPGSTLGSLGGTQNLIFDSRPGGIAPKENEGLGYTLPADASICFNYHRYNFAEKDQLNEIWVNFYYMDESEVKIRAEWSAMVGGLGFAIPPGDERVATFDYTFRGITPNELNPARLIQLVGHRHPTTYRFAAWINDKLIYESYDWQESFSVNYDSLTKNKPIATEKMTDGAVSGIVPLKNNDVLKYSCFIRNTTDVTLRFVNELYTGEMCNMFGQTVGTRFAGAGL